MHLVPEKESILKGLNSFKAIAKQDLLVAETVNNPEFWQRHAESRRLVYKELIAQVEQEGVDSACARALNEYRRAIQQREETPESKGKQEALENFLALCGFEERTIKASQSD
ncbi:MAG: hypothetical protein NTV14_08815 [Coprothermobacterota bacterium]|nr:hypothetical protein [Coprothermobacterota bacterium]